MSAQKLTQYALFLALILLLGLTPIGYILLPMAAITLVHMPVIIGSYFFSLGGSMLLGSFFGITSLINAFIRPDGISMIVLGTNTGGFGLYNLFLIIIILFIPRIMVGVVSHLTYKGLKKYNDVFAMGLSAFLGSLTNTVLLLGFLYLFAFSYTGEVFGLAGEYSALTLVKVLLGIVSVNGVIEAIAATVLCTAIGKGVQAHLKNRKK